MCSNAPNSSYSFKVICVIPGRNHRNDGMDLCQRGYRYAQPENGNGLDAIEVERTVAFLLGFLTFAQGLAAQLFIILKRLVH